MYLVFSSCPTLTSWVIRISTASAWSHVDMLWDDGTLIGSVSDKQGGYAAGVQKLNLDERLKYGGADRYRIDRFHVDNENAARDYAESQLGKHYDWGGVFAMPFVFASRDWQLDDRWFCSELVAACAIAGGSPLQRMQTHRVTPAMVERSPLLTEHLPTRTTN